MNDHDVTCDELYHYGVKGMKWGVKREARVVANVATHTTAAVAISKGGSMAQKALKNTGNKRLKSLGSLVNIGAKAASMTVIALSILKVKEISQEDDSRGSGE